MHLGLELLNESSVGPQGEILSVKLNSKNQMGNKYRGICT